MEEFRDIKEYDKYQVSNLGRIYSKKRRACVKVKQLAGRGYFQVRLMKDGHYIYKNLHRLVAETFVPNPNNYKTVVHIDGDKKNNRWTNLEWADIDKAKQKAISLRYLHMTPHFLTKDEIIDIYKMYSLGVPLKDIAELYEVKTMTITKLVTGKRHKELFRQYRDKFNL